VKVLDKMEYKGQTTAVAAIFVLVGMMFLVPVITEKALAMITSTAMITKPKCSGELKLVSYHLEKGIWKVRPSSAGCPVMWKTNPNGPAGWEIGDVTYKVMITKSTASPLVKFSFSSPPNGNPNTCHVTFPAGFGPVVGDCTIKQGMYPDANYQVWSKLPGVDGGKLKENVAP